MSQFTLNLAPERRVWTVTELTARIRDLLTGEFQDIWIEGEVSNFREAQSGHLYFTLKDAKAQIRCVCFRNQARLMKFRPEDGLALTVRGSLGVYEQRGEYQIYVEHIEPVGLGALQLAFEQLKARLEKEGLFDAARKRPLPVLPRRVGIVTSPTGAAIRDILRVLKRRFPNLHVIIYPVRVQGEGAAKEIVDGLRAFNRKQMVDVIILARGGGSLEDLWAFNEEIVARAIRASGIPVMTGVGHETDFTIADFAADARAPTPSAAAEMVVRSRDEFVAQVAQLEQQMVQWMRYRLLQWRDHVRELATHAGFRRLEELLRERRQQTDDLVSRLGEALRAAVELRRRRLTVAATRLVSFDFRPRIAALRLRLGQRSTDLAVRIERVLVAARRRLEAARLKLEERSPLRVLERGYAICYDAAGNVLRGVEQVAIGDAIGVQLANGRLGAEVKKKDVGR